MTNEIRAALQRFTDLTDSQLEPITPAFQAANFAEGAVIFAAGDRATRLYWVCAGEVVIRYWPLDGGTLDIARIGLGGVFGWSAAIRRAYYTAAAIASTAVEVIYIEATELMRLMTQQPATMAKLLEQAARLSENHLDAAHLPVVAQLKQQPPTATNQ